MQISILTSGNINIAPKSSEDYYRFVYQTGVSGIHFITCPLSSGITQTIRPMYCDTTVSGIQAFASGLGFSGVYPNFSGAW